MYSSREETVMMAQLSPHTNLFWFSLTSSSSSSFLYIPRQPKMEFWRQEDRWCLRRCWSQTRSRLHLKLETVTLSEMKHEEVEALVEFMYSVDGSIPIEVLKKHVRSLYLAADKYEIPHLRDLCRNELISSLNSSNALNVLELAQIPFDTALYNAAFTAIRTSLKTIASSAEFKLFVVKNPNLTVEIMKDSFTWSGGTNLTRGGYRKCSSCENLAVMIVSTKFDRHFDCVPKDLFFGGFAKDLKEKWHTDLRLKAGNSDHRPPISAHKLVLAARSEVFKRMLDSDVMKASSGPETITFSEMRHEELETLVEFMYSNGGSIAKLKEHVRSLYLAADKYEIPYLRALCRKELISSLNRSNALDVLELSQIHLDRSLQDAALSFIARNINTIVDSGVFRLFVARNPNLAVEITKAFMNPIMKPCEDESEMSDDESGDEFDDSDDY
ncbi:unnamed protein product [Thlaspi arvense]|uniref:BTB domain-containing protein n=1 Tax=Thlaspi arvense TaxID=13288 RepID=A0AAU9S6X0_THLAR|nr:unnamed protein product [Thlaspi arvense]